MSDRNRIGVGEAVRELVDLADELRRSEKGHLFVEYAPHVGWVNVVLYAPTWHDCAEMTSAHSLRVDDGTIDAVQMKRVIAAVETGVAGVEPRARGGER